jgi:hypothetical protein
MPCGTGRCSRRRRRKLRWRRLVVRGAAHGGLPGRAELRYSAGYLEPNGHESTMVSRRLKTCYHELFVLNMQPTRLTDTPVTPSKPPTRRPVRIRDGGHKIFSEPVTNSLVLCVFRCRILPGAVQFKSREFIPQIRNVSVVKHKKLVYEIT